MRFTVTIHIGNRQVHIGDVINDVFYKRVKGSKHLFKKADAWGIDAQRFKEVISKCKAIRILDEEENIVYTSTPEQWEKSGQHWTFGKNRAQIFLPRCYQLTEQPRNQ